MADRDRPTRPVNDVPGVDAQTMRGKKTLPGKVRPSRAPAETKAAVDSASAKRADAKPTISSEIEALYEIIRSNQDVRTRLDAAAYLLKLIDEGRPVDPETLNALYGAEKEITVATALKRALNKIRIRRTLFKDPTGPYDRKLTAQETRKLKEEIDRLRGLYDRFHRRKGAFDRKYDRLEKIGEGGMAGIFRAARREDGRVVAIKFLRLAELSGAANPERVIGLFRREGELLTRCLDHPHVLKGYEYGEADGEHFIVLDHVRGGTLEGMIDKRPLDFALFKRIALQLCDAVGYIHRQGVIHRDIKPANILIEREEAESGAPPTAGQDRGGPACPGMDEGGSSHGPAVAPALHAAAHEAVSIRLADFGLAKDKRDRRLSRFSFAAGTDDFSSPQQLADARDADERDDIFSMGKTFYEMLAGRTLKNSEDYRPVAPAAGVAGAESVRSAAGPRDMGRWDSLNALIRRCIAPERAYRWQTVGDLEKALRGIG
jgi:serine/threonine protein kinase